MTKIPAFRLLTATAAVACVGVAAAPASAATPGQLDAAFGGGIVTLDPGSTIAAVAAQTDGKVVAVGSLGGQPYVVRLNADGSRDAGFKPDLPAPGSIVPGADGFTLSGVAMQSGGRVVLVGTARTKGFAQGMVAVRLQSSGARDASFDSDGVQTVAAGDANRGEGRAVAVGPDGSIALGGQALNGGAEPSATVARLSPTGAPEGKLGGGVAVAGAPSKINGVAVQADGKIVGVGDQTTEQIVAAVIARTNGDGALDTSFRGSGSFTDRIAPNAGGYSSYASVAIDGSGRAVAAGQARQSASPGGLAVTSRFQPNGAYDGFGDGGKRFQNASVGETFVGTPGAYGLALDGATSYLGGTFDINLNQLSASRLDGNGGADGGFGEGGIGRAGVGFSDAFAGTGGASLSGTGLYVGGVRTNGENGATAGVVSRFGASPYNVTYGDGNGAAPGPGTPTTPKPVAPKLSKTSLKPSKITRKKKATLRYTLSKAGFLTLAVEQKAKGRKATSGKAKGTCGKASSKNKKGKSCTYYAKLGTTLRVTAKKGAGKRTLSRKVTSRTLKNGTYRLVLQTLDSTRKATGTAKRITFKVTTR